VFQPCLYPHTYLGGESLAATEHRRTNNRGESGIDNSLATYYDENPLPFEVARRLVNKVQLSSFQGIRLFFCSLICQRIFRFGVQLIQRGINKIEIALLNGGFRPVS